MINNANQSNHKKPAPEIELPQHSFMSSSIWAIQTEEWFVKIAAELLW